MMLIETRCVTMLKMCFGFCIMCLYVKVMLMQGVCSVRSCILFPCLLVVALSCLATSCIFGRSYLITARGQHAAYSAAV